VSLADTLAALSVGPRYRNRVDELKAEMPDDEYAFLLAVLANPEVKPSRLQTAMSKEGHTLSFTAIKRWREANGIEST